MSSSLPTLFRNSSGYRRELTLSAKGVVVTETSSDPRLTKAIRQHAEDAELALPDAIQNFDDTAGVTDRAFLADFFGA